MGIIFKSKRVSKGEERFGTSRRFLDMMCVPYLKFQVRGIRRIEYNAHYAMKSMKDLSSILKASLQNHTPDSFTVYVSG